MAKSKARRKSTLDGIHPDIAEGLQHLGLSAYEIRVYNAILSHPRSRVPEIARYSSVPQPKVYATIKRLIERGLCESHLGPINQYSALEPGDSFDHLLEESNSRQKGASHAIEMLAEMHNKATQGLSRREGRIKLFQGRAAVLRNFRLLASQSTSSIASISRMPLIARDDDESIKERLDAGVKIRLLGEVPDELSDEDRRSFKTSKGNGAKVRLIPHVPMRMAIFDGRITVLPLFDPVVDQGDGMGMLEIRNHGLSESFLEVFDMLWEKAKAF